MNLKFFPILSILFILSILAQPIYSAEKQDFLDEFATVATRLHDLMLATYRSTSNDEESEVEESYNLEATEDIYLLDEETLKEMRLSEHHIISQKLIIPLKSTVIIKGDIHGDHETIPALLNKLEKKGKFKDGHILQHNLFLVFLGDYIDRGPDSIKVIKQITDLKEKNPQNVFLLRGNHETPLFVLSVKNKKDPNSLINQLYRAPSKYKSDPTQQKAKIDTIAQTLNAAFSLMPQILFVGYEDAKAQRLNYAALLHGGIPTSPRKTDPFYQNDSIAFYSDATQVAESVTALQTLLSSPLTDLDIFELDILANKRGLKSYISPYLWNDFLPTEDIAQDQVSQENPKRGPRVWALNKADTQSWINNISTPESRVHFIVRGHQQSPRRLFEEKGLEGLARRWNGLVLTLDYSPRVPGFQAQHDIYLTLKPRPEKRPYFKINLLRLPYKK